METTNYKIHELAQKLPDMLIGEYRELKESIRSIGQSFSIISYKGEIIDGRHRLKACIELGIKPRLEEYSGTLPVAAYILASNIRRNLTKAQRHQMYMDFLPFHQKVHPPNPLHRDPNEPNRVWEKKAFMDATGANNEEAWKVKFIGDNAPELAPEVMKRGGLTPTVQEARRRKSSKDALKTPRPKEETLGQRIQRMTEMTGGKKLGLTKEQVDPDFKGTHMEFVDKYGHVQIRTKAQMELDRDQDAFSAWVGGFRKLKGPLEEYLKLEIFKPSNFDIWLKRAGSQERRLAETKELVSLIVQTRENIEWLLPVLENYGK
jgi:ParB-like nuclease domain